MGAVDDSLAAGSSFPTPGHVKAKAAPSSAVRMTMPSLPPPFRYESLYSSYKQQWAERKRSLAALQEQGSIEISDLEWFQTEDDPYYYYLLGCTSTGHVSIWKVSNTTATTAEDQDSSSSSELDQSGKRKSISLDTKDITKPIAHVQVSQNPLYTIQWLENQNRFLITGVDGILTIEFRELLPESTTTTSTTPPPTIKSQGHIYDWWKNKSLGSIQQAVSFENYVYAANSSGDAFKFDVEGRQCVSTYQNPSRPYNNTDASGQSTIALVRPTDNAAGNSPLVLVGTASSGKVLIWDVSKDQGMDSLDVGEAITSSSTNTRSGGGKHRPFYVFGSSSTTAAQQQQQPSISTIHATDQWWSIAGCQQGPNQPLEGGFISTWHGPTRSLVTCTYTNECIQKITSLSVSSGNTNDTRLISVGNEGVVSCWDSLISLQRTHRVWSSPPSIKSIAVLPWNSSDRMTRDFTLAVGGVGSTVDLLEDYCKTKSFTL